jgi:glycosyltransferase involved in cell wall biosynthesis
MARVPISVYTAHGFYFHDRMGPVSRRVHLWIEKVLGRTCTDFLFTVSAEDARTAVEARIIEKERLHCLESVGVDLERFHPGVLVRESQADMSASRTPVAVFVGRVVKEKGIYDLIRAIRRLKDEKTPIRLLVVGGRLPSDRSRGTLSKVQRLVRRLGLEEEVRFLGHRQDVPDILRSADLLVLPSHREGMPVTVLEAMATGKPVVVTDIRGCREEVVDEATGLVVPPEDPSALAEAIRRLVCNPEEARRMGRAGRERAEQKYDFNRVIAEQLDVYGELMSNGRFACDAQRCALLVRMAHQTLHSLVGKRSDEESRKK